MITATSPIIGGAVNLNPSGSVNYATDTLTLTMKNVVQSSVPGGTSF